MSIRKINFVEGAYYHVFNRGVDKRDIFGSQNDLLYFFKRLIDLNVVTVNAKFNAKRYRKSGKVIIDETNRNLVSIVSYCLLQNHFHLVLKQESENGISKFMQRLGTSYTMYFNQKYKRSGSLFQGKFKANMIDGEFGLSILSVYVNLNYIHHRINPELNLVKSSIFEYLGNELGESICDQQEVKAVINEIGTLDEYKEFSKNTSKVFGENKGLIIKDIDLDVVFE
ncbi:transposase [Candidatus Thioglobus sp.]|uniref:transposase n=1 Tax=Candidatus Thioglobus sp. TaxID=2026721 RepID=UPI003D11781C